MFIDCPRMLGFFGNIGPMEWIVIGIVAVLIFGKRLPEIGRSLGRSFVQFKKGLHDIDDDIGGRGDDAQSRQFHQEKPKSLDEKSHDQTA